MDAAVVFGENSYHQAGLLIDGRIYLANRTGKDSCLSPKSIR